MEECDGVGTARTATSTRAPPESALPTTGRPYGEEERGCGIPGGRAQPDPWRGIPQRAGGDPLESTQTEPSSRILALPDGDELLQVSMAN